MGVFILVGLFALLFAVFIFSSDRPEGPSRSISESMKEHFSRGR
jgi:hypothetical protein